MSVSDRAAIERADHLAPSKSFPPRNRSGSRRAAGTTWAGGRAVARDQVEDCALAV